MASEIPGTVGSYETDVLVKAMQGEMRDLVRSGQALTFDIDPLTALQLVGLLQLTLRHPHVSETHRATASELVEWLKEFFAGCPAITEVIRRGDDPAQDLDVDRPRIILPS